MVNQSNQIACSKEDYLNSRTSLKLPDKQWTTTKRYCQSKIPVQISLLTFMKFVLAVTTECACVPNVNKICNVLHRSNVWGTVSFQSYQERCQKNKNDVILVPPMLTLSISNIWIWFIPFQAMPPFCTNWKYQKNGENIRKRNIA